jgi:hypothetical protein
MKLSKLKILKNLVFTAPVELFLACDSKEISAQVREIYLITIKKN